MAAVVLKELRRANKIHGNFRSIHEGYAVMLEEMDELWDEIKKRYPDSRNLRCEATQLAAMAMKLILFLNNQEGYR